MLSILAKMRWRLSRPRLFARLFDSRHNGHVYAHIKYVILSVRLFIGASTLNGVVCSWDSCLRQSCSAHLSKPFAGHRSC